MTRLLLGPVFLATTCYGGVPTCETKIIDGEIWEVCSRQDVTCLPQGEALRRGEDKGWTENWDGCLWPATIIRTQLKGVKGLPPFGTTLFVTAKASYIDSESMDATVWVEWNDGTFHKYEQKVATKASVVGTSRIVTADFQFLLPMSGPTAAVPKVDTVERGGKRSFSHRYD